MNPEPFKTLAARTEKKPGVGVRPVRFYLDVDGTILPDDTERPGLTSVELPYLTRRQVPPYDLEVAKTFFQVDMEVVNLISDISHRDDVDLVWLTGWKYSAPFTFDEHFNIRSIGWLDWAIKLSDYSHSFKRVAVHEDQELSPTRFVWADDLATSFYWLHEDDDEFPEMVHGKHTRDRIPKDRYLLLNPDSRVGLTVEDLQNTINWLDGVH